MSITTLVFFALLPLHPSPRDIGLPTPPLLPLALPVMEFGLPRCDSGWISDNKGLGSLGVYGQRASKGTSLLGLSEVGTKR